MTCRGIVTTAAAVFVAVASVAQAGTCTGHVTDIRAPIHYDRDTGSGYLAVRSAPGGDHLQLGELYLGDQVAVTDRIGRWYRVACLSGHCLAPLWGAPAPEGWVYGRYLRLAGQCP